MMRNKFFSKNYILSVLVLLGFTFGVSLLTTVNASAATAPVQVTGLEQIGASSNDIQFSWTSVAESNAMYEYCFSDSPDCVGGNDRTGYCYKTMYITGLNPASSYYMKVRAFVIEHDDNGNDQRIYGPYSTTLEVVTKPLAAPNKVWQIAATTKSITLKWNAVNGANYYKIQYGTNINNRSTQKEVCTKGTSIVIGKLSSDTVCYFRIYAGRKSSSYETYYFNPSLVVEFPTLPSKVSGFKMTSYGPFVNLASMKWKGYEATEGYQVQLYCGNQKLKTYTQESCGKTFKNIGQNKFYRAKVRAYILINGKKTYGDYSDWFYFAQQPNLVAESTTKGEKVTWDKVTGATNYSVYVSTNALKGFKKCGTTTKNSMIVKKYGSSKLEKGGLYYFYVVANKKVGTKTFKSGLYYPRSAIY